MSRKLEIGQGLIAKCRSGQQLNKDEALCVLEKELSDESKAVVLATADKRTRDIAGNRGRVYAAIGVDSAPCARNCAFCSHGARWGVYEKPYEMTIEEVCRRAAEIATHNPNSLTLRTTQDYGIDRLCLLAREVRAVLPPETILAVNTGEFASGDCDRLLASGVGAVYHTFRLREGTDTGVTTEERLRTLSLIKESGLELFALVEPVGPEHTDDELVEAAFRLKDYDVNVSGVMARVPVAGTPLAKLGKAEDERLIRIAAMTRLISGPEVEAICVHPPIPAALHAGANEIVVDCGAIPRDQSDAKETWRSFDFSAAKGMLREAGFEVR
jgi:biotin synthase